MFWIGMAIGTLFGGGLLVAYERFLGQPHARELALFNIKADEIRRSATFAQNTVKRYYGLKVAYDNSRKSGTVADVDRRGVHLEEALAGFLDHLESYDLLFLTFSKPAHDAHLTFFNTAEEYRMSFQEAVESDEEPQDVGGLSQAYVDLMNVLQQEIDNLKDGKGFRWNEPSWKRWTEK